LQTDRPAASKYVNANLPPNHRQARSIPSGSCQQRRFDQFIARDFDFQLASYQRPVEACSKLYYCWNKENGFNIIDQDRRL
jgi:hypothetical protein